MNKKESIFETQCMILLRILVVVAVIITIFIVIYSVAQGVPLADLLNDTPNGLLPLGSLFTIYSILELVHHKPRKEKQNVALQEVRAESSNTENHHQTQTKRDSNEKLKFWLSFCCGVATTLVLAWLLYDRVLH